MLLFPTTATPYHDVSLDFILTFIDEQLVIDTFRYNIDFILVPAPSPTSARVGVERFSIPPIVHSRSIMFLSTPIQIGLGGW